MRYTLSKILWGANFETRLMDSGYKAGFYLLLERHQNVNLHDTENQRKAVAVVGARCVFNRIYCQRRHNTSYRKLQGRHLRSDVLPRCSLSFLI